MPARFRQLVSDSYIPRLLLIIKLLKFENLVKYQKVSKSYAHDCLQNFLFLFVSLLTASVVKNSHILAVIYFIFLNKRSGPNLKVFLYRIWPSVKGSEK